MTSSSDALLPPAIAGDNEALSLLWREHRRWVAAVLLAHLPPGVDVEDLLQEVAVTFVANLRRLREVAAFRPWLRTVAVNVARTAGRRRAVQRKVIGPLPETADDWPADPERARAQHRESTRDTLARALEILNAMHPDYREPMWLRAMQGLSQQQIADTLG